MLGKLQKQNLRKWIAALRSRKFKQGKDELRAIDDNTGKQVGFCCLGVACKVFPHPTDKWDGHVLFRKHERYEGNTIPKPLRESLGLTTEECARLANWNDEGTDGTGVGFKKIASLLEHKLKTGERIPDIPADE